MRCKENHALLVTKYASGDMYLQNKPGRDRKSLTDDMNLIVAVEAKPKASTGTLAVELGKSLVMLAKYFERRICRSRN